MTLNLLRNGAFETDWGDEKSHHCLIFPEGSAPRQENVGNIFTPPGWVTWFRHKPGQWDQPEVRDAWKHHDPRRVHSGQKAMLLFTFFRRHDAGFFQQVEVSPGTLLKFTARAHAWSNGLEKAQGGRIDDPYWSDGVGTATAAIPAQDVPPLNGDPQNDAIGNFLFSVGIDPTGGDNPFSESVVWGDPMAIYNEYAEIPPVEATAEGDTVTVFLRSKTLWPFKHNDAYWDDAQLTVAGEVEEKPTVRLSFKPDEPKVGEIVLIEARSLSQLADVQMTVARPSGGALSLDDVVARRDGAWRTWTTKSAPLDAVGLHEVVFQAADDVQVSGGFESARAQIKGRGSPREQYKRTYVLLPPGADSAWALAVVDSTWNKERYTIGSSADDAGIGDLDVRRVIAVNPGKWPTDLKAFFDEHYPGVDYQAVEADDPQALRNKLRRL